MLKTKLWRKIGLSGAALLVLVSGLGLSLGAAAQPAHAANCPTPNPDLGSVTLTVNPTLPTGSYKAWVRMQAADSTNNSVSLEIGGNCFDVGDGGTPSVGAVNGGIASGSGWSWVDYQNGSNTAANKLTFNLTGGTTQTFRLVGREPGVKVDRVLILDASDPCVPTNTRDTSKNPPVEPGDNCQTTIKPSVTVTQPTANQTFSLPAGGGTVAVPLTATTQKDPSGAVSITKVEFYNGVPNGTTNLIATTTTPSAANTYTSSWNAGTAGSYSIYAKVYDNQNNVGQSASGVPITVIAPVTKPTVSITSPVDGAKFSAPAAFTLSATPNVDTAHGVTVSKVEFFENGTLISGCSDTTAPYQCAVSNLAAGSGTASQTYTFTAKVTDSTGQTGDNVANPTHVNVYPRPAIVISSPTAGSSVTVPQTVTVQTTPTVGQGLTPSVTVSLNGAQQGGAITAAPFNRDVNLTSAIDYTITATVTDSIGATATASVLVHGKNPPCTTPPSTPSGLTGSVPTGTSQAALSWTASTPSACGGLKGYNVYRNNGTTPLNAAPLTTTNFNDTNVSAGQTYSYQVTAVDNTTPPNESSRSNSVNVTIPQQKDTTPPSVPTNLTKVSFSAHGLTFKWDPSVDPNPNNGQPVSGVAGYHVTRTNDNAHFDVGASTTPSFTDTNLQPNITYVYQVVAFDNANNGSGAAQISIKTASLPTVALTAPSNNASFAAPATINFAATAQAFDGLAVSKVDFYRVGSNTPFASDASSPYAATATGVGAGNYAYFARVTDSAGDTVDSAPVNVTVNGPIAVTLATDPNVVNFGHNTVLLSATPTVSAGRTVSSVQFFANGQALGGPNAGNYNYSFANIPTGNYAFTAVVTDSGGATATSNVLNVVVRKPGDASGDGSVDIVDFSILQSTFSTPGAPVLASDGRLHTANFNHDSLVDIVDFSILQSNWNG